MLKSYRLMWCGVLFCGAAALATAGDRSPRRPAADLGVQIGPETTFITSPLDDLGYPDYVRALNERQSAGVSHDENFWVLMWPAIGNAERSSQEFIAAVERELQITIPREPVLLGIISQAEVDARNSAGNPRPAPRDALWEQQGVAVSKPWTRDQYPAVARWIAANETPLEMIHQACLRPKAYAPLVCGSDPALMIAILLPHVQTQREAARALAARGMLRLGEGDSEGSWQDLTDMYRLARHTETGWTLIEQLVGYAIRAMAQAPLAHWLSQPDLTPEELQRRWSELEPLLEPGSLSDKVDSGERYMYLDTVLWLFSGGVNTTALLSDLEPNSLRGAEDAAFDKLRSAREMAFQLLFLGADVNVTLRHGNRTYDRLVAALQPATHLERKMLMDAFEHELKQDVAELRSPGGLVKEYLFASNEDFRKIPGRVLVSLLVPAINACENAQTKAESNAAALEAAFRLRTQFASSVEFPTTVEDLAATIASLPADPYTGQPLKLAIDDRGIAVYSVGMNGVDDGGKTYGEGDDKDDLRVILNLAP